MAEIKVMIDGKEYTKEQFKKDLVRMFDICRKSNGNDKDIGKATCRGVGCDDCPLYSCSCSSEDSKADSFEIIKIVHEWAIEHPVITNKDMLKKTFGKDVIHYIEARPYKEKWLDEEYKEPKGEKQKWWLD